LRSSKKNNTAPPAVIRPVKISGDDFLFLEFPLLTKKVLILRGQRGYVMCGYLNLGVADKSGDVAVKVSGVGSLKDLLNARVAGCSSAAKKIGIRKDQPIKKILPLLA
jgi:uncharacterized protein YunC (DUF1805 family)